MFRIAERQPGYNIFLGTGDSVERALGELQRVVQAAEVDFEITVHSMSYKSGENRNEKDTCHAVQVCTLKRRCAASEREPSRKVSGPYPECLAEPASTTKRGRS